LVKGSALIKTIAVFIAGAIAGVLVSGWFWIQAVGENREEWLDGYNRLRVAACASASEEVLFRLAPKIDCSRPRSKSGIVPSRGMSKSFYENARYGLFAGPPSLN
jgi:hypothetical protein